MNYKIRISSLAKSHIKEAVSYYKKEINMVGRYKQWLGMMSKHYPQAKTLWNEVKRIKHLQEMIDQLQHTTS